VAAFTWVALCGVARADIGNLGQLSFDELVPGAINNVTIVNFTSAFALPPAFPVVSSVTFLNSRVILTDDTGTALAPILLGDLDPGVPILPSLQFLSTQSFQSVEFLATLSVLTFNLSGGFIFQADTNVIDTLLLPSSGSTLIPGLDLTTIAVTGTTSLAPVPEPDGWLLLLTTVAVTIGIYGNNRRVTTKSTDSAN
jgi:hypothetical protein